MLHRVYDESDVRVEVQTAKQADQNSANHPQTHHESHQAAALSFAVGLIRSPENAKREQHASQADDEEEDRHEDCFKPRPGSEETGDWFLRRRGEQPVHDAGQGDTPKGSVAKIGGSQR